MKMIASFNNIQFYLWPFLTALFIVVTAIIVPLIGLIHWAWIRKYRGSVRPENWVLRALVWFYLLTAGPLAVGAIIAWSNKMMF